MKTLTFYSESEWLKWRMGGISASDAAVIAGEVDRPNRVDLWLQKTGVMPPIEANEAMRFGKAMEPAILELYQWKTGESVVRTQICVEADDTPFPMRATLDGITASGKILEFKAVSTGGSRYWPEDGDSENLPPRVIYQVQHQMRAAGRPSCVVVAAIPLELRIYEVQLRDDIIVPLMQLEAEFWDHVVRKTCPPYDDEYAATMIKALGVHEKTVGLSLQVQDAVDAWETVKAQARELEHEEKRLKDRLLSALCNHRYGTLPDGRTLDCNVIQIAERTQHVKAHTQIRLSVKKPKE